MNAKLRRQSSTIDKWKSFHCAPMIRLVFIQSSSVRQQYRIWQDTNHLDNGNKTEEDNEVKQREYSSTECRELHFRNPYPNGWSKKILMDIGRNILELCDTLKSLKWIAGIWRKNYTVIMACLLKTSMQVKKKREKIPYFRNKVPVLWTSYIKQ